MKQLVAIAVPIFLVEYAQAVDVRDQKSKGGERLRL